MVKSLLAGLALVASGGAHAWTTIDVMSAISCNADMDRVFYYEKMTQYYGKLMRTEGGAHWFKGKDSVYGATIREIFVSAGPPYLFVGVVLEAPPTIVADAIKSSRFAPANMFFNEKKNKWVGSDGREMVWHEGKYAKVYCIGMRDGR